MHEKPIGTFGGHGRDIVFEQDRDAMQKAALAREFALLVEGGGFCQGRRVHLEHSAQLRTLQIHLIDARKIGLFRNQSAVAEIMCAFAHLD